MIAKVICIWFPIAFCFGQSTTFDVCSATLGHLRGTLTLRGTGMLSRGMVSAGATVLFDYTCSLATANGFVLPSAVFVETSTFAEPRLEARFRELKPRSVFQALVRGRLECAEPFKVQRGDDGDIIGGNGFGPLHLYRCRMLEARFLALYIVDSD